MQLLWFELSALVVLILLLRLRWWLDAKQAVKEQNALPPGQGFDTISVQARLEEMRQDYGAAATSRSRRTPNHDVVVMAVRRSLAKLAYFRSAQLNQAGSAEQRSEASSF